jgi:hypothetical protein
MPKLKFTAAGGFDSYEGFFDGTIAEVTEERAAYLLETFGAYFSEVGGPTFAKAASAPDKNRMAEGPKKNK